MINRSQKKEIKQQSPKASVDKTPEINQNEYDTMIKKQKSGVNSPYKIRSPKSTSPRQEKSPKAAEIELSNTDTNV